jgi:hypothetical protein
MDRSRSYFKLVDALKQRDCPVCRLVLEDSRTYLDHLLYEMVLDVPTRMTLTESFGFCSWHARQIPTLAAICAPSTGFSIIASDLLRKLDYVGRAVIDQNDGGWNWKSWFKRKRRKLLSLVKERPCPACEHVRRFESYHIKDLLDFFGDSEFCAAFKAARGLCLPHLFILEENYSSHPNFPLLLEAQLAKVSALRNTLEGFIRKQDYRFRDEITPEEATCWTTAMEILTGKPEVFANEMGHDLSQRSRTRATSEECCALERPRSHSYGLGDLDSELKTSKQVTLCLKKPLPADLLDRFRRLTEEKRDLALEAIVEDLDISYLRGLHSAGSSLFYGIALPPQSIILLDCKRGFLIEDDQKNPDFRLRPLKNAEDLYLRLLWRKFGIAVLLSGTIKEEDPKNGLFCLVTEEGAQQWCRISSPAIMKGPPPGSKIEGFAWQKWGSQVLQVIDLRC